MGAFSREQQDHELLSTFMFHWNNQQNSMPLKSFQLRDFEDKPELETLDRYGEFLRSDHARFWVGNHEDYYVSFKSIVISDTGPSRGLMKGCYHASCDSAQFNATQNQDFASLDLLEKVTQTAIDMLLDLTDAKCSRSSRKIMKHVFPSSNNNFEYTFYDKSTNTSIKGNNPYVKPRKTKTDEENSNTIAYYYTHYIYYYVVYYPLYYLPSLFYMG